ncbi:MAG: NUDIX domain-containing protein [Nitrospiraceae bacterium]|nr:NUDIX domain-containing protein [Nitrospiraceae bacterium]
MGLIRQEQFEVLDCTGRRTGERIGRDDAHRTGIWHGAFHCLITYPRVGKQHALFQLRSSAKKIAASRFDVSVGGHYAGGETVRDAAPREISEELGIEIAFTHLVSLGKRVSVYCFEPGIRELEFQDVFLLPMEGRPTGLSLQESEVDGLLEVDVEKGLSLFSGILPEITGNFTAPDGSSAPKTVRASDFVPSLDNYYCKLLILARRYAAGERNGLAI